MRVSVQKSKNYTFLYIVKDFYSNGKRTTKIVEKLGTMDSLRETLNKSEEEVLAWARNKALIKTNEEKEKEKKIVVSLNANSLIPINEERNFNCGYLFLQSILYKLKINNTFRNISSKYKCEYSLESIFTDLIYSRVLSPSSKRSSYEFSKTLLEAPKYELEDVYRALSIFSKESDTILKDLYRNSNFIHTRNTSALYYDCTNYYFEIEDEEGYKRYGKSKEHRPNPIVGMGLFMDGDGIPLSYSLYPGNQNEQVTLKPLEKKIIKDFDLSKFIYCSDAGLASVSNKKFNSFGNRAYIITQSLKKLRQEDKELALDKTRFKSINNQSLKLDLDNVNEDELYYQELPLDKTINERLIITYSPKYAAYQKNIRKKQIERATAMISKNGKVKKERRNPNDPSRFIKTISTNTNGEKIETTHELNEELINEESKYDGFYAITTNLEDDDVSKIIAISERRWQIEECFRIMKTDFKARPVYLQREDRINAHFLTCFTFLLVIRLLEILTENKYTINQILTTIRTMNLTNTGYGHYIPAYKRTNITDDLHNIFKYRTDYEIITGKTLKTIIKESK